MCAGRKSGNIRAQVPSLFMHVHYNYYIYVKFSFLNR